MNLRISEIPVAQFPGGTQRWTRARARLVEAVTQPGMRRLEGFTAAGAPSVAARERGWDFARVKILTKAGTLRSRTSSQGGVGMEKAAWEGGDAHGKEATRSDKDSRRRRHYGSGLAAGATSGTAAGTFATGWAATAVAAPASAFAGSTLASSLAVTMSACASA